MHLNLTLKVKGNSLRFAPLTRCFAAASPVRGRGENLTLRSSLEFNPLG